jgi:hypothetical protein
MGFRLLVLVPAILEELSANSCCVNHTHTHTERERHAQGVSTK